ncbi:L,D-transpeptidase family protein [Paenibacillus albidus]|nr:L,D-transpeptidase family protein [Paenibacillus albidus]
MLVFVFLLTVCLNGTAGTAEAAGSDLIIVNKKTNKLAFFSDGKLVKTFPVATGKLKELTPEGSFPVVVKVKNRPYYKENIPGGDPANPLGDRWLGLEVNGTKGTTYAIHGNNNESSIGKYVSAGCIRMHNDDIHWLYPKVARNTKVVITTSSLGMETLATNHGYKLGSKSFAGSIMLNGVSTKLKAPFMLKNSRVYVPLRESVAVLGGTLQRDAASGALIITAFGRTVKHVPFTGKATVNGKTVTMIPSLNENNRLMLPLGSLPALLGLDVEWKAGSKTAVIKK